MQGMSRRRVAIFIADQLAKGESPQRVAKVLAAYLVENKRIRDAGLLLRDIETALLRRHNHLVADVTSARKLSSEMLAGLREMLVRETDADTAEIVEQIDADLIGGMIVRTPDAEMDTSLRTKLTRLKAI
jgi:F-type H+-transporting ATPase subunit delta